MCIYVCILPTYLVPTEVKRGLQVPVLAGGRVVAAGDGKSLPSGGRIEDQLPDLNGWKLERKEGLGSSEVFGLSRWTCLCF